MAKKLTILFFFVFFFISYLQRHVYNSDFWWHLAAGKYITETRSLPTNDPFAYTSQEEPSTRKSIILRGYWLAQVAFYKIYDSWSAKGIITLRSVVMSLFLFFVFLAIKKQRAPDILAVLLTVCIFFTAKGFLGERPQLFTFLTFSIVLYLLEAFRTTKSKKIFLIPFIIFVLSNMHPGFVVCILLVALYTLGTAAKLLGKEESPAGSLKTLCIVLMLSAIASLLNPNGLSVIGELLMLSSDEQRKGIVEHMPTFSVYFNKFGPVDYSYISFLVASSLSLRYIRKTEIIHLLSLVVFSIMSFVSLRYIIFYMAIAAPLLAATILNASEEKIFEKFTGVVKRKEKFTAAASGIIGIFLVFVSIPALAKYEFKESTFFDVPKGAADFLAGQQIEGNMFNEYGFGGYLIWRLYPEKKVFIDGRSLETNILEEYQIIASSVAGGRRSWEDIAKKYDITYIVMPPLMPRGEIYPIVETLFDKDEWALIYYDHLSLVFLRNDSRNVYVVRKLARDKIEGLNTIILQAAARANKNPTNPYYFMTLGKVFFKMKRFDDSHRAFTMALQRDPHNALIKKWLQNAEAARAGKS
ncbi:MAG: hypothetical protein AB1442_03325 [Nitrospirota bacterium]